MKKDLIKLAKALRLSGYNLIRLGFENCRRF